MQRPGASPGLQRRGSRLVSFRRRHWGAYHPAVCARTLGAWLSAAAVTLGSGCSSAAPPSPVRDTQSVERSGAAASVPEAPAPNPPPRDDEMIALGEAASTCPWSDSESGPSDGFDTSCAAFRAWREYRPRGRPLDEATLVEWLASGDARRRYLAKEKLWESGASYRTDPPLAAKVIEAATKERSLAVSRELGVVVGRIDLRKTGTTDAITVRGNQHACQHEASVSQVSAEQVFYMQQRGLSEAEASTMIVSGFIEPLVKELPMEYAVEMNRLIELQMEGTVG